MPTRADCLNRVNVPAVEAGDIRYEGGYYRLQEKVKGLYGLRSIGLKLEPPPQDWRWDDGGLSVSSASCTCAECSLELHSKPGDFRAVLRFDIEALSKLLDIRLAAKYSPTREPDNPCHYEVYPETESIQDLQSRFKKKFKFPPKLNDAAREQAVFTGKCFDLAYERNDEETLGAVETHSGHAVSTTASPSEK